MTSIRTCSTAGNEIVYCPNVFNINYMTFWVGADCRVTDGNGHSVSSVSQVIFPGSWDFHGRGTRPGRRILHVQQCIESLIGIEVAITRVRNNVEWHMGGAAQTILAY